MDSNFLNLPDNNQIPDFGGVTSKPVAFFKRKMNQIQWVLQSGALVLPEDSIFQNRLTQFNVLSQESALRESGEETNGLYVMEVHFPVALDESSGDNSIHPEGVRIGGNYEQFLVEITETIFRSLTVNRLDLASQYMDKVRELKLELEDLFNNALVHKDGYISLHNAQVPLKTLMLGNLEFDDEQHTMPFMDYLNHIINYIDSNAVYMVSSSPGDINTDSTDLTESGQTRQNNILDVFMQETERSWVLLNAVRNLYRTINPLIAIETMHYMKLNPKNEEEAEQWKIFTGDRGTLMPELGTDTVLKYLLNKGLNENKVDWATILSTLEYLTPEGSKRLVSLSGNSRKRIGEDIEDLVSPEDVDDFDKLSYTDHFRSVMSVRLSQIANVREQIGTFDVDLKSPKYRGIVLSSDIFLPQHEYSTSGATGVGGFRDNIIDFLSTIVTSDKIEQLTQTVSNQNNQRDNYDSLRILSPFRMIITPIAQGDEDGKAYLTLRIAMSQGDLANAEWDPVKMNLVNGFPLPIDGQTDEQ